MERSSKAVIAALLVHLNVCLAHSPFEQDSAVSARERAVEEVARAYRAARPTDPTQQLDAIAPGIYVRPWLWEPGQELLACFWNGSESLRLEFVQIAETWLRYGNLRARFRLHGKTVDCIEGSTADIRISLDSADPRPLWSDSSYGKTRPYGKLGNVRGLSSPKITLNIPNAAIWREDNPADFKFHVLHETGHVLGFLHEHQRGLCDSWYDVNAISAATGLTIADIRSSFEKLPTVTAYDYADTGPYDKYSIMQYNFPRGWLKPDPGNPCLRPDVSDLSDGDKKGVERIYGVPVAPPQGQSMLATIQSVQATLQKLAANAESLAVAKATTADVTEKSAQLAIDRLREPKKNCSVSEIGIRTCYFTVSDQPAVHLAMDRLRDDMLRVASEATTARDHATKLRALQQAHERLSKLK